MANNLTQRKKKNNQKSSNDSTNINTSNNNQNNILKNKYFIGIITISVMIILVVNTKDAILQRQERRPPLRVIRDGVSLNNPSFPNRAIAFYRGEDALLTFDAKDNAQPLENYSYHIEGLYTQPGNTSSDPVDVTNSIRCSKGPDDLQINCWWKLPTDIPMSMNSYNWNIAPFKMETWNGGSGTVESTSWYVSDRVSMIDYPTIDSTINKTISITIPMKSNSLYKSDLKLDLLVASSNYTYTVMNTASVITISNVNDITLSLQTINWNIDASTLGGDNSTNYVFAVRSKDYPLVMVSYPFNILRSYIAGSGSTGNGSGGSNSNGSGGSNANGNGGSNANGNGGTTSNGNGGSGTTNGNNQNTDSGVTKGSSMSLIIVIAIGILML